MRERKGKRVRERDRNPCTELNLRPRPNLLETRCLASAFIPETFFPSEDIIMKVSIDLTCTHASPSKVEEAKRYH